MAAIAIDARKYFDYGIGSYIQNLVSALAELNTAHKYTLFASGRDLPRISAPAGWSLQESNYGKYSWREFAFLGRDARAKHIDLFHEPHYTLPVGLKGRSVVTIHDLIQLKMPEHFSVAQRTYAKTMIGHAVRHAGAIIAVSNKTKSDILETFKVGEERVHVVHHGVRTNFRRIQDSLQLDDFRRTRDLRNPYVLYVGNIKPHKNIPRLLTAFSQLRTQFKDLDLVFAGGSCLADDQLSEQARTLGIAGSIRDLKYLSDDNLVCAYNAAEVVVLPSLYEGFGFPALEAMACGTPVVVSTAGSLVEIVGDAALIVDPLSPEAIAEGIRCLLTDSQRRSAFVAKGIAHAKNFTWRDAGKKTLDIYEKVLKG